MQNRLLEYPEPGTSQLPTPGGPSREKLLSSTKNSPKKSQDMPPLISDEETSDGNRTEKESPPLSPKDTIEGAFHMHALRNECLSLLANKANRFAVLQNETVPRVVPKKTPGKK